MEYDLIQEIAGTLMKIVFMPLYVLLPVFIIRKILIDRL